MSRLSLLLLLIASAALVSVHAADSDVEYAGGIPANLKVQPRELVTPVMENANVDLEKERESINIHDTIKPQTVRGKDVKPEVVSRGVLSPTFTPPAASFRQIFNDNEDWLSGEHIDAVAKTVTASWQSKVPYTAQADFPSPFVLSQAQLQQQARRLTNMETPGGEERVPEGVRSGSLVPSSGLADSLRSSTAAAAPDASSSPSTTTTTTSTPTATPPPPSYVPPLPRPSDTPTAPSSSPLGASLNTAGALGTASNYNAANPPAFTPVIGPPGARIVLPHITVQPKLHEAKYHKDDETLVNDIKPGVYARPKNLGCECMVCPCSSSDDSLNPPHMPLKVPVVSTTQITPSTSLLEANADQAPAPTAAAPAVPTPSQPSAPLPPPPPQAPPNSNPGIPLAPPPPPPPPQRRDLSSQLPPVPTAPQSPTPPTVSQVNGPSSGHHHHKNVAPLKRLVTPVPMVTPVTIGDACGNSNPCETASSSAVPAIVVQRNSLPAVQDCVVLQTC